MTSRSVLKSFLQNGKRKVVSPAPKEEEELVDGKIHRRKQRPLCLMALRALE